MRQYLETKQTYPDCLLFFRIGDFYEMFFEDAEVVSRELSLVLTGKDCGLKERAPMCGVPFHALDSYLYKLVQNGYKVAIGEQLEDPKLAKGLVKRDVIRIVTPGTITNSNALDETKNNYLMSILYFSGDVYGVAACDASTGDFYVTQVDSVQTLRDEIYKFAPAEIISNKVFLMSNVEIDVLKDKIGFLLSTPDDSYYDETACRKLLRDQFHVANLSAMGLEEYSAAIPAAGALLRYLAETQRSDLSHITGITTYQTGKYMILDTSTRRNLELTETLREKQKKGSLLWVLDKTKTAMGARCLRTYIEQPLIDREAIIRRQGAVESFVNSYIDREELREYLNPIYDMERLIVRISLQTANPKDLIALKSSLEMLPHIKSILNSLQDSSELIADLNRQIDSLDDLYQLIDRSIVEDPPLSIREGGIIKDGYHAEADLLRQSKTNGKQWILEEEAKERERTGISKLKIGYNRVFGYYIEITNSFKDQVPEDYIRKQTLANAERYITPHLKELEDMILGAEDKLHALEYELYCGIREKISSQINRIHDTAKAIAAVDAFASLAVVAQNGRYVRPNVNNNGAIRIKNGRHPVVEKMIQGEMFIENDVELDKDENRLLIITGPNMAGKSTYMRQVALITLMAQIGSFVPAEQADIGICDRIFTRVGASDDLASGQSTFMVEMNEVANILRNSTENSLVVLDEIGRGTSTFDGLSIAWAVAEYISRKDVIGAKTLFATHYHEMTTLEGKLEGVHNYCIAVKEQGDNIVFLRKIIPGGADKSYGIQVAKLAGVPDPVIVRAKEILAELAENEFSEVKQRAESAAILSASNRLVAEPSVVSTEDFPEKDRFEQIKKVLSDVDVNRTTPFEALSILYDLSNLIK